MRGESYLNQPKQYKLVYEQGSSFKSSFLVLKALPNSLIITRYGLSVSRKVGKAVTRNKIKRWLREILRETQIRPGWDLVFIARPKVTEIGYWEVKKALASLLYRAQLLVEENEKISLKTN